MKSKPASIDTNGLYSDSNHHLGISLDTLKSLVENTNDLTIPRGLSRTEVRAYVRANATYRKNLPDEDLINEE